MITRIHIENFKSLVDFDLPESTEGELPMELGHFVCLVGMNGSGKTTVLQALDFLAQLMHGRMREWLEHRNWDGADLASRISKSGRYVPVKDKGKLIRVKMPFRPLITISFSIHFNLNGIPLIWSGRFNRSSQSCTAEEIAVRGAEEPLLVHQEGVLKYVQKDGAAVTRETKGLIYEGSILTVVKVVNDSVERVRDLMLGLKSLELLTPGAMRRRSRKGDDIGYGGERLAGFLDSLKSGPRTALLESLQKFYPNLRKLEITTARGGWKKLIAREWQGTEFSIESGHMNDGMLRVIAILAQAHSTHPVLLFDEIENGINPELVEKLVDFLVAMEKQVIVTTHSPMILNYLEDETARESVYLLYRDQAGWARSVRFFDIPETAMKLKALGPGEVFVDTNLTELTARLAENAEIPAAQAS